MTLPMSNSQLDNALRERWENIYQSLHELVLLYNVYLPISAADMLEGEYTLPEGYTVRLDEAQVLDTTGQPNRFYTEKLRECILRKGALAAARTLESVLRNEGVQGLTVDPNSFVKHFVDWRYRYFG
jgi:hypothetical protein